MYITTTHKALAVTDLEIQQGGSATSAQSAAENFWAARPLPVTYKSELNTSHARSNSRPNQTSRDELIRECVTVPGCCCCMPLLHNHLMDSCSYVKNTLLAAGQVENAETETEVRKRKYGNGNTEVRRKPPIGAWFTNVPCRQLRKG